MRLRIGVIGLGKSWGQRHRPALMMMRDRFQVQAVYASVSHLAVRAARDFEADAVDGFRALISRRDIDAVLVLDTGWHDWLPLVAACDFEKAVYWASGLEIDAGRAAELKEMVDQSGIAFMAEFPRRYAPATLRLKELIATKLGRPQLLFCHRRLAQLHTDVESVTLPTFDDHDSSNRELVEMIDWCRYIVDANPTDLVATTHEYHGRRTYQQISLRFPDRGELVGAEISCGQYVPESWDEAIGVRPNADMQIRCEHGLALVDLPSKLVWFDEAGRHVESLESELPVGQQLLTQFHRSVTSLVRKMASLEDAYHALQILRSAKQSAREGRRIMLQNLIDLPRDRD